MQLDAPELENELVRMTLFDEGHVQELRASTAVKSMWESMPDLPKGTNFEAYAEHILTLKKKASLVPFAIHRCSDGAFAGVISFENMRRVHRRLRISHYWHPETMRGSGVFQASQALMIGRALDWGARRIAWMVPARNVGALAAIRSLGAREEGFLRSFLRLADGTFADMVVFAFLHDEARAALPVINDRWRALMAAAETTT